MSMSAGGGRFKVKTTGSLRQLLQKYQEKVLLDFSMHREQVVIALTRKVMDRTPVWEGETLANWQWSVGTPRLDRLQEDRSPSSPGHTGHLGAPPAGEPRRAAQEAQVLASMRATLNAARGQLVDLYLSNNGSIIGLVEYGLAPSGPASRQPAGVLRVALREVMAGI